MEVSGSSAAPAQVPATVSLEEQSYKAEVAQIRAGNLKDSEKQMQIKKLTHEVMLNLMKSEVSAPTPVPTTESIQKFGKIVGGLPLALVLRVMSFIERLSLNDANGIRHKFTPDTRYFNPITSSEFLVLVRECLTKKEKAKLNELLALFVTDPKRPADDEIERCFAAMGVDFKKACLEEIIRAIQDRTLSKQDVEITARVIKKELTRLNISRDFVEMLVGVGASRVGTLKVDITHLRFIKEPIKVVPNILAEFKNITHLDFNGCTSLTTPPDLSGSEKLRLLDFTGCTNLTKAPDLSGNEKLGLLTFNNCTRLIMLPDLSGNEELTTLSFSFCTNLTMPPDLSGNEKLGLLYFASCTRLTALPDLSHNQLLTELSFLNCRNLIAPPDLKNNRLLTILSFRGCSSLTAPPDLSTLTHLKTLYTTGVFPKGSGLNRNVLDDLEEAQSLRRAIEEYRKKTKRKFEAADPAEAPPEKRGRSHDPDSDSDDFDAVAAQVASNWTDPKLS